MKCEDCNNKGYIFTYNDKNKIDEFQRCDNCMVFTTAKEAKEYINNKCLILLYIL